MKTISAVMMAGIFLVFTNIRAFSQNELEPAISIIEPHSLEITYAKTTNLVFPYAIKSVDRGSKDVLVQKAKGIDNVLQIKAGIENFKETNLTVITADGKLYSYLLNYVENPPILNIQYRKSGVKKDPNALFSSSTANEAEVQACAEKVIAKETTIRNIKDKKYGVKLQLIGLYVQDEVMYFQIRLQNNTNIKYDIAQFSFFVRDQKKSKRTAAHEIEIKPLQVLGNSTTINPKTEQILVVALPKFTIPDKKNFHIQMMENNGGRHLKLKIHNPTIVRSEPINI
ncbi:conjugative transposon protein TraN [Rubrolithibacter danxiaensis]|uniref:conjugative transposon protein TraN n=1 Tax=Rubrolithibacter danxiaensis TaxID=3390805 RepID=UPI003BF8F058